MVARSQVACHKFLEIRQTLRPGPKVSFVSARWGTESEGWYVDLPYAVWVGVNYSLKVNYKLSKSPDSVNCKNTIPRKVSENQATLRVIRLDISDGAMYYYIPLGIEATC
jgi:hypothetical protein